MNKKRVIFTGLAGVVFAVPSAWAQAEDKTLAEQTADDTQTSTAGSKTGPNVVIDTGALSEIGEDKTFFFKLMAERGTLEVKPIKGAPYSAEQTTTTTQTLPDGNRIVQTSAAKIYRDSQGRMRIEHSLGNIGSLESAQTHTMIQIDDPVAGAHYNLEPENHTARRIPGGDPVMSGKLLSEKINAEKRQGDMTFSVSSSGGPSTLAAFKKVSKVSSTSEDLGTQTMEGLKVSGTRAIVTIPAGGEGNELPMQIVDERWYSPDLQTNVKTIHTDPRMGQTVFTLSNVSRANPDPSLFQIPSDYQVTEGRR